MPSFTMRWSRKPFSSLSSLSFSPSFAPPPLYLSSTSPPPLPPLARAKGGMEGSKEYSCPRSLSPSLAILAIVRMVTHPSRSPHTLARASRVSCDISPSFSPPLHEGRMEANVRLTPSSPACTFWMMLKLRRPALILPCSVANWTKAGKKEVNWVREKYPSPPFPLSLTSLCSTSATTGMFFSPYSAQNLDLVILCPSPLVMRREQRRTGSMVRASTWR
mmetsp:Transcript_39477/g.101301  ORF Transcript_39477/g.101301 Transcript_39477/m.101301 type:complete len:219 (+) Transcript_39477:1550-2206(+)